MRLIYGHPLDPDFHHQTFSGGAVGNGSDPCSDLAEIEARKEDCKNPQHEEFIALSGHEEPPAVIVGDESIDEYDDEHLIRYHVKGDRKRIARGE